MEEINEETKTTTTNEEWSFSSLKNRVSGFLGYKFTGTMDNNDNSHNNNTTNTNTTRTKAKTLNKNEIKIYEKSSVVRDILGVRVVMISDTHNDHRSLDIPPGDILIHAGDWTCYGAKDHTDDFNEWLGTLPHEYKIVINGNHESNAPWKRETKSLLSNAIFLVEESLTLQIREKEIKIYGSNFYWPMREQTHNPYYDMIPDDTDILVVHGPPKGYGDGGRGCPSLRQKCLQLTYGGSDDVIGKLRLVVCGHIHFGYGVETIPGLTVVNASMCKSTRKIENSPIVLDL